MRINHVTNEKETGEEEEKEKGEERAAAEDFDPYRPSCALRYDVPERLARVAGKMAWICRANTTYINNPKYIVKGGVFLAVVVTAADAVGCCCSFWPTFPFLYLLFDKTLHRPLCGQRHWDKCTIYRREKGIVGLFISLTPLTTNSYPFPPFSANLHMTPPPSLPLLPSLDFAIPFPTSPLLPQPPSFLSSPFVLDLSSPFRHQLIIPSP